MTASTGHGRRTFLKTMAAAGVLVDVVPRVEATPGAAADPEALVGSPRWPGSRFRASDLRNRFHDVAELMEISRSVPDDVDGYLRTWKGARETALARAVDYDRAGRVISAGDAYFQASNYAGREYVLHLRMANVPMAQASYRTVRELFDAGIARAGATLPFERIRIPYGQETLHGIFVAPPRKGAERFPVVYRTGGTDSCKEASYMTMAWSPFVDRGVACLLMDAPGQGQALNEQGIRLTADFERAVTAALDVLVKRSDVDAQRFGVYGQSTGGYFGARAAAYEKRISAVVLQGACYDLLEDCYLYCPSFRPHLRYLIGALDDADARAKLASFNLREGAPRIRMPISVVHGVKDDAVRFAGAERLFQEIGSKEKQFQALDAVRGLGDSAAATVLDLVDWLSARLSA
jgi:dipeptidyl aminopeptidase/acylaminoacyl peptidase